LELGQWSGEKDGVIRTRRGESRGITLLKMSSGWTGTRLSSPAREKPKGDEGRKNAGGADIFSGAPRILGEVKTGGKSKKLLGSWAF